MTRYAFNIFGSFDNFFCQQIVGTRKLKHGTKILLIQNLMSNFRSYLQFIKGKSVVFYLMQIIYSKYKYVYIYYIIYLFLQFQIIHLDHQSFNYKYFICYFSWVHYQIRFVVIASQPHNNFFLVLASSRKQLH